MRAGILRGSRRQSKLRKPRSTADPTPKSLFERFRWFGELPIVYDQSGKSVFDSWDYCRQRAEELFRKRGPAPS
jgi:hypothetical protein